MLPVMFAFGALTVISALGVIFSSRSLHSALWLVATLFLVAIHYALLGADFIASLQVLIYAGAIMVLVVFVIMLLGLEQPADMPLGISGRIAAWAVSAVSGVFIALLSLVLRDGEVFVSDLETKVSGSYASPEVIGRVMLTQYVYPFEITALLLLAAIIGAVVLAYEPKRPLAKGRGLRAMHQGESENFSETKATAGEGA